MGLNIRGKVLRACFPLKCVNWYAESYADINVDFTQNFAKKIKASFLIFNHDITPHKDAFLFTFLTPGLPVGVLSNRPNGPSVCPCVRL